MSTGLRSGLQYTRRGRRCSLPSGLINIPQQQVRKLSLIASPDQLEDIQQASSSAHHHHHQLSGSSNSLASGISGASSIHASRSNLHNSRSNLHNNNNNNSSSQSNLNSSQNNLNKSQQKLSTVNGHVINGSNLSVNNGSSGFLGPAYQYLKSRGGSRRSSCPTLVGKDGKSLFAPKNPINIPHTIVSAQNSLNADPLTYSVKSALRRNYKIMTKETEMEMNNEEYRISLVDSEETNLPINIVKTEEDLSAQIDLKSLNDQIKELSEKQQLQQNDPSGTNPVQSKTPPTPSPFRPGCIDLVKSHLEETEQICRNATRHRSTSSPTNIQSSETSTTQPPPIHKSQSMKVQSIQKLRLQLGTYWPYDKNVQQFIKDHAGKNPLTSVFLALVNYHQSKLGVIPVVNNIELRKLEKFMTKIEKCYQKVPYHNLFHAVDVLAANDVLLNQIEASKIVKFTLQERITALLAAACHDVGHPGVSSEYIFNNTTPRQSTDLTANFALNDSTEKSQKWNGMLERFHTSVALENLRHFNVDLSKDEKFCELFEKIVMATDMTRHFELVNSLKDLVETRDEFLVLKHRLPNPVREKQRLEQIVQLRQELLRISLHAADLSNPAKEFVNSRDWAVKVIDEFFLQGDCERQLNGKIKMPMNDRDLTSIKSSQVGFIDYVVKPLVTAWGKLLENVEDAQCLLQCVESNKICYQQMP